MIALYKGFKMIALYKGFKNNNNKYNTSYIKNENSMFFCRFYITKS